MPQLAHLEDGLKTYGLLASIQQHPSIWEPVFVSGKGPAVTANSLIECLDTEYSESQVKREKEADTYTYFCDFVYCVEMKGNYCRS